MKQALNLWETEPDKFEFKDGHWIHKDGKKSKYSYQKILGFDEMNWYKRVINEYEEKLTRYNKSDNYDYFKDLVMKEKYDGFGIPIFNKHVEEYNG